MTQAKGEPAQADRQDHGPTTIPDQRLAPASELDPTQPVALVQTMADHLRGHGLKVRVSPQHDHVLMVASQPAVSLQVHDSPGGGTPGLSQEFVLALDGIRRGEENCPSNSRQRAAPGRGSGRPTVADEWAWYLLWSSVFRGGGKADLERIASGADITGAADVIRKVLRVNE